MLTFTRRIPRPSVALVVAFAALFSALGGTGYAALKITGASIVNGTVTGADVDNKSLGQKELKLNTLDGSRIKESSLGTVPNAQHAATADNAANAQNAAKAADSDTVGGIPAAQLMTVKPRASETSIPTANNFANGAALGLLADVAPGTYVIMARLTYDNDGGSEDESCTLSVPGANDVVTFYSTAGETETVTLQEVVSSEAVFNAVVSCSSDGNDDTYDTGSIIAMRLD